MSQALRPFRVTLRDGSTDEWGHDADAASEVERDGLRVLVFKPLPGGLHRVRTARVYMSDEWTNVESLNQECRSLAHGTREG